MWHLHRLQQCTIRIPLESGERRGGTARCHQREPGLERGRQRYRGRTVLRHRLQGQSCPHPGSRLLCRRPMAPHGTARHEGEQWHRLLHQSRRPLCGRQCRGRLRLSRLHLERRQGSPPVDPQWHRHGLRCSPRWRDSSRMDLSRQPCGLSVGSRRLHHPPLQLPVFP